MSDVYAPPKAELHDKVENGQYGSVEQALIGNYQLNIKETLSEAWSKTKGAKKAIILAYIIPMIISFAISFIVSFLLGGASGIGAVLVEVGAQLLILAITLPMFAGVFILSVKRSTGMSVHFNEIFQYWHKTLPLLGAYVLMAVLIILGFILLVLPGIYLTIAYSMAIPLIVEKDMSVWQALETSRKAVTKKWFTMFGMFISFFVIGIIGFIALIVGLLWAIPFVMIAWGIVYRNMFGVEERTLKS